MNIYIAGPMRGIPEFNFPAFFAAESMLNAEGHAVFNPARRDNEKHGTDISADNPTGDEDLAAEKHGFDLREALGADTAWICASADAIYLLEGWSNSSGARAEKALAEALGLEVRFASLMAAVELTPEEHDAYNAGRQDEILEPSYG